MYSLLVMPKLAKELEKLARKDKAAADAFNKKVNEVLQNPYHYKPLMAPLQGYRRVHVMGCFVLIYSIDEKTISVVLHKFAHHDEAYH